MTLTQFQRRYHQKGTDTDTDTGDKTYTGTMTISGSNTTISSAVTNLTGTAITLSGATTIISSATTNLTGTTTTISGALIASSTASFTGVLTATGSIVNQPITTNQFEGLDSRFRLVRNFGGRGKPAIQADVASTTEAVNIIADPDFEIVGSGATTDDVTFYAEGGITMTTDGSGSTAVVIAPHLGTDQSAWTKVTWGSDKEVRWECLISTDASIADVVIYAGLKLTNTAVTITDADQAFFRYAPATNSGKWEAITSNNDSDDEHDTGVVVATGTLYHLLIVIDASRVPRFYINGVLVETGGALRDTIDFIPYIGVLESTGTGKVLHAHSQAISRAIG